MTEEKVDVLVDEKPMDVIAKYFGVAMKEEFEISKDPGAYRFAENGLEQYFPSSRTWALVDVLLIQLLRGTKRVITKGSALKINEDYFYNFYTADKDGFHDDVLVKTFVNDEIDQKNIKSGNWFRRKEQARAYAKKIYSTNLKYGV